MRVVARPVIDWPAKATVASGTSWAVAPDLVTSAVSFLVPVSMRRSESLTSKPWPVGGAGEEKVTLPLKAAFTTWPPAGSYWPVGSTNRRVPSAFCWAPSATVMVPLAMPVT